MAKPKRKKTKSIAERHKRRNIDFRFPHIKIVGIISLLAVGSIIAAWVLDDMSIPFWSSILANIFAGLVTGLVICLISGTKQIAIAKLESRKNFLTELNTKITEFQNLYNELLRKQFSQYDGSVELFDFIYDVGSHANWVNDYILQGSFDEMLALDPREYCKEMGYDAFALVDVYEELHQNLYSVDTDCPTKKEIVQYFAEVEKALRGLKNTVYHRQHEIDAQLEKIKYSLF